MMQIILLNPPWQVNGRFGVRAGSRWPFTLEPHNNGYINYIPYPFFLAYATSLLKKNNKNAKLIDAIAEGMGEQRLIEEIKFYNPDLIVIETSTPSFKNDIRIAHLIHQELSDLQIALCGTHVSVFYEQILKEYDFINYILIGEYEYTLLDLVNHLENNLDLNSILGLAYKKDNKIIINNLRPTIDNLNSLPWPERENLPIYNYNDGFCNLPQPNVQVLSSRGCPFRCIFCLWPQTLYREHKYRKRDPVDVAEEIEYLVKKFNFKAVYFDDDVFNIDREHVLSICREIKKRNIEIPWAVMARADFMDEELLRKMKDVGLYAIKYGIESANQEILNLCKKNMNLNKAYKIIEITKRLGIKVHLTFCLGLPGENKGTALETIQFIEKIKPDSLQFSFATPFPGTEYFNYIKNNNQLISEDWSDYDGNYKCVIKTKELSNKDLERIAVDLRNYFNL